MFAGEHGFGALVEYIHKFSNDSVAGLFVFALILDADANVNRVANDLT